MITTYKVCLEKSLLDNHHPVKVVQESKKEEYVNSSKAVMITFILNIKILFFKNLIS